MTVLSDVVVDTTVTVSEINIPEDWKVAVPFVVDDALTIKENELHYVSFQINDGTTWYYMRKPVAEKITVTS